jgi:hypothetical protein
MSDQKYCLKHTTRLVESGAKRFYFDTYVIQWVIENHPEWFGSPEQCYLCKVSENQVVEWLKKTAELEAGVKAGGGSYTTEKLAVSGGEP